MQVTQPSVRLQIFGSDLCTFLPASVWTGADFSGNVLLFPWSLFLLTALNGAGAYHCFPLNPAAFVNLLHIVAMTYLFGPQVVQLHLSLWPPKEGICATVIIPRSANASLFSTSHPRHGDTEGIGSIYIRLTGWHLCQPNHAVYKAASVPRLNHRLLLSAADNTCCDHKALYVPTGAKGYLCLSWGDAERHDKVMLSDNRGY